MRNIRTVGDHNAHADGEREECEAHGVEQRVCRDLVPLRREEELKTFPGTGQRQTANNQDDHQHKQQRHEHFRHALDTLVYTENQDTGGNGQEKGLVKNSGHRSADCFKEGLFQHC